MSEVAPLRSPAGPAAWRGWLLALAAAALAVAAWQSRAWWREELLPTLGRVEGGLLLLAFAVTLAYRLVNCAGWGLTIRALRQRVDLVESSRLWLACESLRWLPGSVWSYGSRTALAGRLGLGKAFAALSIGVELALTVAAWTLTALLGGLASPVLFARLPTFSWPALAGGAALLATGILLGFALWHRGPPRWLAARIDWPGLRALRPDLPATARVVAFYVGLCLLNGLGLWLVLAACPGPAPAPALVVAANAVGWILGFFALIAPGGLGVREAGIVAVLAPAVPLEQAVLAAALWRLVQIATEITGLAFAALWPASE